MLDVLVRGGLVVDGTGGPGRRADVGVRGGRIVAIGPDAGADGAARVVDADGQVVAPGFVDIHTHYDAQVLWDGACTPSPYHGVTTVIAGNCGLTLAPIAPEHEDFMVRLLARVEQIPVATLAAGVDIRWRTFAEYLDVVAARPLAVDVGFMVGHSAVRRAVMGDAASSDPATPAQRDAIAVLLHDALAAGGFGFSSATAANHRDGDGRPTPPNFATPDELLACAEVVGAFPGTCLEVIPASFMVGFTDADARLLADLSARADRHLNWNTLMFSPSDPDLWRRQLAASEAARGRGGWVVPQMIPHNYRTRTDLLDAELGFRNLPGWDRLFAADRATRVRVLADPETRRALRHDLATADNPFAALWRDHLPRVVVNDVEDVGRFGDRVGRTLGALAAQRPDGGDALDALFDLAVETGLGVGFCRFAYDDDDPTITAQRQAAIASPAVLLGASDGGAHVDGTVNTEYPTATFAELVRGRGWLTLEDAVHRLADVPARLLGLHDRGRIAEGLRADLVVFDPTTVGPGRAELVADLPAGARRLVAGAEGIDRVMVAGVDVVRGGALTGDHPGRVLRAGRDSVTVRARA
ncbi:MAG: N-acyl-D-amino-acid deacylase family protein [Actinomycetota bacterium]